jgi:AcrR family transcriptional regulator
MLATPTIAPPLPPPAEPPRRADITGERLLQALHELLYEREGGTVSVSEVCERASANVAMVRYCFGNKDGLMLALTRRITDHFRLDLERLAEADLPWREKLERNIGGIVRNYMRFPYINRLLSSQLRVADERAGRELSESLAVPLEAFHAELLAQGTAAGEIREVDAVMFFFSIVGMCEFIFAARGWLLHGFGAEVDDVFVDRYVDHVVAMVMAGLGTT